MTNFYIWKGKITASGIGKIKPIAIFEDLKSARKFFNETKRDVENYPLRKGSRIETYLTRETELALNFNASHIISFDIYYYKKEDSKKPKAKKFRVNQCLRAASIADHNCIFYGCVINRTEKTLTLNLESESYGIRKRKIYKDEKGNEYCFPLGKFSMAPIFRA